MLDSMTRARNYLKKVDGAVSGSGGHNQTFRALSSIWRNFGNEISKDEFITLANEYNARCEPPWNSKDLQHKIDEVLKKVNPEPATKSVKRSYNPPSARQPQTQTQPAASAAAVKENKKFWKSEEEAQAAFDSLTNVRDDSEVQAFIENDYGLDIISIPNSWRVMDYQGRRGIVYAGYDLQGNVCAYKWRSIERKENGKRYAYYLYGAGGYLCFPDLEEPDAPLILCGGEEKAAAANMAGFHALTSLTGEHVDNNLIESLALPKVPLLLDNPIQSFILAFDNDPASVKANEQTAAALVEAGFTNVKIVQWPDGAPKGYDLNDVLKERGVDGLRAFLESAKPCESNLPRVLCMGDFLTAERPPLQFHIDGILPHQGKMTFSATAKFGKSMVVIQIGICLAAGNCQWLGFQFGAPARVLYLQAEISDLLLEARLKAFLESMPENINRERALKNFHIQEISAVRPNLFTKEGRETAKKLIKIYKPSVLILDPLAAICPGLEENAAESMGAALNYFSEITRQFECAVILVHHHGKGGVSRGSSVFEAWAESDITAARLDNDPDVCRVDMRLRCVYNPGTKYWRMPNQDNLWFADMPDYVPEKKSGGCPAKSNPKQVKAILELAGHPLTWTELRNKFMELTGLSKSSAQNYIDNAVDEKIIMKLDNGHYSLPENKEAFLG